jgi:hypothetical protein
MHSISSNLVRRLSWLALARDPISIAGRTWDQRVRSAAVQLNL